MVGGYVLYIVGKVVKYYFEYGVMWGGKLLKVVVCEIFVEIDCDLVFMWFCIEIN